MQRSELTVDLGAVRRNVKRLRDVAEPAALWAVVKANGYGHGAGDVAAAALGAGATALCVATVAEGLALRDEFRDATGGHANLTRHIANSAGTLRYPDARFDAVRCGVAIYGLSPFGTNPTDDGIEPALLWHSQLAAV